MSVLRCFARCRHSACCSGCDRLCCGGSDDSNTGSGASAAAVHPARSVSDDQELLTPKSPAGAESPTATSSPTHGKAVLTLLQYRRRTATGLFFTLLAQSIAPLVLLLIGSSLRVGPNATSSRLHPAVLDDYAYNRACVYSGLQLVVGVLQVILVRPIIEWWTGIDVYQTAHAVLAPFRRTYAFGSLIALAVLFTSTY